LRRRFSIEEASLIIAQDREEDVLIRPVVAVLLESYSKKRKRGFFTRTPWIARITPVPRRRFARWGSTRRYYAPQALGA
jgi:hypothetical protein